MAEIKVSNTPINVSIVGSGPAGRDGADGTSIDHMETTAEGKFLIYYSNGRIDEVGNDLYTAIEQKTTDAKNAAERAETAASSAANAVEGFDERVTASVASINKAATDGETAVTAKTEEQLARIPEVTRLSESIVEISDDFNSFVTMGSEIRDITGNVALDKYIRVKAVDDGTNGANEYSSSNYSHTDFIDVSSVTTVFVSARGGANCPVCLFYSSASLSHDNFIGSSEILTTNTVYDNTEIPVPNSANFIIVQTNSTSKNPLLVKASSVNKMESITEVTNAIEAIKTDELFEDYVSAQRKQYEERLKPFAFKPFDKAYVTFTWDDGNAKEAKMVYDIFHEYGYPVCFSLPPSSLNNEYNGQTMADIARLAIADGGEVFSHDTSQGLINGNNCTDEFVRNCMRGQKKGLMDEGFYPRGQMLVGGTGQIVANNYPDTYGKIMDKWCRHYYDFSDLMGFTDQYYYQRSTLNTRMGEGLDSIISRISGAKWTHFMAHRIDNATTEPNITTSMLRQVLDYIKAHEDSFAVVNASYIYDHFGSK